MVFFVLRLIRLLLLVLPLPAAAQSKLPPCPAFDFKHNCFGSSSIFPIGNRYVGEYKDGKPNGQGVHTFASGDKYVGEVRDSKAHGRGAITFANGRKHVGEFRDGKYHGQGIEYHSDGTISRSGQWIDGDLAQPFTIDRSRFPFDGSTTVAGPSADSGRAERDRLAASAQSRLPPCPVETKVYRHNCFGTETYALGVKYVGEWQSGIANGRGTITLADGGKYVGDWKDDRREGPGIEYRADGTINRSGRWVNGVFAQSFAIDGSRFPFHGSPQLAGSSVDAGRAERDRLAAEAEAAQRQQRELEQRQAAEQQRQAAEAEAARRKQQELEQKLAELQKSMRK